MTYEDAARAVAVGYAVDSGNESLHKVAENTWVFVGEDHVSSVHPDIEAADILENTFPGSPAGLVPDA